MGFVKASLQSQQKKNDYLLLLTVVVLVIFGLMMVYDASAISGLKDFKDSGYYIRQQLIWVAIGISSMIFFANFHYKRLKPLSVPVFFISVVLLFAVLIPGLGVSGGGAHRWLKFGKIVVQPAEIIKLTAVLYLARLFKKR